MRVLVGCEESGNMRDAFLALGHEAYSNDLVPARRGGPHFQCDVMEALHLREWDLIILHPECTCMCVSGNSTYGRGMHKHHMRITACAWTKELWEQAKKIAKIGVALENPQSVVWRALGVTPQYVQPYQFGHLEQKKTGFALDRLPRLRGTNNVYAEMMKLPKHKRERIHYMSPGKNRSRDRSESFPGICAAAAQQWGGLA